MSFDLSQSQDVAVRILSGHIRQNRLAQTYLLTGNDEPGKEAMALSFASALNGDGEGAFEGTESQLRNRIQNEMHPDVKWVGRDTKVKSIKIEEIRDILKAAYLRPFEADWKFFIIIGAERMTVEASNAFLKTLEEPPQNTIFILIVQSKEHLLDTIQSRSFEVRLKPGSQRESEQSISLEKVDKSWDEFLETYQTKPRPDVKTMLVNLLEHLDFQMKRLAASGQAHAVRPLIELIDRVVETMEALDANANQKLSLSFLQVQFRKAQARGLLK